MIIEPQYPKGNTGRQTFRIATISLIQCVRQRFGLSVPAIEEALHDASLSRVALLGITRLLADTTILRFRHLLQQHKLAGQMLTTINEMARGEELIQQGRRWSKQC